MRFDNPWWGREEGDALPNSDLPKRSFFERFQKLVVQREVNRAVVLMGPRRVGKTVMLHQAVSELVETGVSVESLLYVSLDTPIYSGLTLQSLLDRFHELFGHDRNSQITLFFDEIQYHKDWEVHLKSLVDSYPAHRFVVSGSAAAALKLKARESGAGRFTEFLLPPLTFAEYLGFVSDKDYLADFDWPIKTQTWDDEELDELNRHFVDYINFGGYPEAVLSPTIRQDSARFIKSDIIEKVLLRDLPSLYGISDIQELNRLFNVLAYNTGQEVSLEALSKQSGVVKNTLKRYLDYLEAAFLIQRVHRVDRNAKRFQRAVTFKVYLTNPSMRSALFGAVSETDEAIGALVETAIFSQFTVVGAVEDVYYARWKGGEIDFVWLSSTDQKMHMAIEVKWSDAVTSDARYLNNMRKLIVSNQEVRYAFVTTISKTAHAEVNEREVKILPAAELAVFLGKLGFLSLAIKDLTELVKKSTDEIRDWTQKVRRSFAKFQKPGTE